jgi:hypothetical protein
METYKPHVPRADFVTWNPYAYVVDLIIDVSSDKIILKSHKIHKFIVEFRVGRKIYLLAYFYIIIDFREKSGIEAELYGARETCVPGGCNLAAQRGGQQTRGKRAFGIQMLSKTTREQYALGYNAVRFGNQYFYAGTYRAFRKLELSYIALRKNHIAVNHDLIVAYELMRVVKFSA